MSIINRSLDARTKELDEIKIRYDEASIKDRGRLKVKWDKKVEEIAAEIRQHYDKNKRVWHICNTFCRNSVGKKNGS